MQYTLVNGPQLFFGYKDHFILVTTFGIRQEQFSMVRSQSSRQESFKELRSKIDVLSDYITGQELSQEVMVKMIVLMSGRNYMFRNEHEIKFPF